MWRYTVADLVSSLQVDPDVAGEHSKQPKKLVRNSEVEAELRKNHDKQGHQGGGKLFKLVIACIAEFELPCRA